MPGAKWLAEFDTAIQYRRLAATAASSGADLLGGNLVRTLAELCGGKQYTLVLIDSAGDTALLEIPPGQLEILARANPQTTALPWTLE